MKKGSFAVWMALLGMVIVGAVLWFGIETARRGSVGTAVEIQVPRETQNETLRTTDAEDVEKMQLELEAIEDIDSTFEIDVSELP